MGAKLIGPLLLKSIEKLFDGPIKVFSVGDENSTRVTWLDIVSLSRSSPNSFILNNAASGPKVCRFYVKGQGIEISEDDYRLLMSGAPERMLPSNPIPEDESAELGTLNILEGRLGTLIRKADVVASKARQLNYHMKQRKTALEARKAALEPEPVASYSPQPFSPINTIRSTVPGQNGEAARLQQDLLLQFSTAIAPPPVTVDVPKSRPSGSSSSRPSKKHQSAHNHSASVGGDASDSHSENPKRVPGGPLYDEVIDGKYRQEMANRIEKLARGDPIWPPCDRCRRLKFDCAKHLTACTACTKKHAKCSWKDVREPELREAPPPPSYRDHDRQPSSDGQDGHTINVIRPIGQGGRQTSETGSNGTSGMDGLEMQRSASTGGRYSMLGDSEMRGFVALNKSYSSRGDENGYDSLDGPRYAGDSPDGDDDDDEEDEEDDDQDVDSALEQMAAAAVAAGDSRDDQDDQDDQDQQDREQTL